VDLRTILKRVLARSFKAVLKMFSEADFKTILLKVLQL